MNIEHVSLVYQNIQKLSITIRSDRDLCIDSIRVKRDQPNFANKKDSFIQNIQERKRYR